MPAKPSLKRLPKPSTATRPREPLWTGPNGAGDNGGVTQGLLSRYLSCPERFRLRTVEGWAPADAFNARIEYGNLWHACEEALAGGRPWEDALHAEWMRLAKQYPLAREEAGEWAGKVQVFFPEYVKHWEAHPDVRDRQPVFQEQVFDVPYRLPSGRDVRLRGKWDAVDAIGGGLLIQENKTKSTIDSVKIGRQILFDLQSLFYLTALTALRDWSAVPFAQLFPVAGVRYNCVRRPAHKTVESAYKKFGEDQRNGRIGEWFSRWEVSVDAGAVVNFRRRCLDPLLENLCDDAEWYLDCYRTHGDTFNHTRRAKQYPHHTRRQYVYPSGVYNPLAEAGASDLDDLVHTGSTSGLRRLTVLFPELAPAKE